MHILDTLLSKGYFAFIDLALARKYGTNDSQAALIAYLSLAIRNGHLCIFIQETLTPSPELLDSTEERVSKEELESLQQLIMKAAEDFHNPIVREGHGYYFQRYWSKETAFIGNVQKLEQSRPAITFSELEIANELLPEQAEAIKLASKQALTIICGGPGTGKTFTAGQMIRHFWYAMSDEQKTNCRIALAAPTGKAAANLQKSLNRAVGHLDNFASITAKTLHALLGIKFDGRKKTGSPRFLAADIIIVDESSMIDVDLMTHLFASVKPGARLILLGDKYQLPSVEAGSLFADLMDARPMFSVELKQCMRSELKGILQLAQAIKEGKTGQPLGEGVSHLEININDLLDYAFSKFPREFSEDSEVLLERFNGFKVLSSLRQGPLGADAFNAQLHKRAVQKTQAGVLLIEPIILTGSDSNLELFNGESGVLIKKGAELAVGDYAVFSGGRKIPALILPKFDYAYCLSVHKSQGSEYDHVLLLMPPGTEFFGREVFYTAVTRARRMLEIWGDHKIIEQTIQRTSKRCSGIQERLTMMQPQAH